MQKFKQFSSELALCISLQELWFQHQEKERSFFLSSFPPNGTFQAIFLMDSKFHWTIRANMALLKGSEVSWTNYQSSFFLFCVVVPDSLCQPQLQVNFYQQKFLVVQCFVHKLGNLAKEQCKRAWLITWVSSDSCWIMISWKIPVSWFCFLFSKICKILDIPHVVIMKNAVSSAVNILYHHHPNFTPRKY